MQLEWRVIVDKELGIAAEVENIAVAIDLGDGIVGVTQQKIMGIQAQPPTVRKLIHTTHFYAEILLYYSTVHAYMHVYYSQLHNAI